MPIEKTESGTLITGPEITLYRYLAIASALATEIRTGMKFSSKGSTMNAAKRACGSDKRTKRGVLIDMVAFIKTKFPAYSPNPRVEEAMKKPTN